MENSWTKVDLLEDPTPLVSLNSLILLIKSSKIPFLVRFYYILKNKIFPNNNEIESYFNFLFKISVIFFFLSHSISFLYSHHNSLVVDS